VDKANIQQGCACYIYLITYQKKKEGYNAINSKRQKKAKNKAN